MDRNRDGLQLAWMVTDEGRQELCIYPTGQPITNAHWEHVEEMSVGGKFWATSKVTVVIENMRIMRSGSVVDVEGRVVREPEAIDVTSSIREQAHDSRERQQR